LTNRTNLSQIVTKNKFICLLAIIKARTGIVRSVSSHYGTLLRIDAFWSEFYALSPIGNDKKTKRSKRKSKAHQITLQINSLTYILRCSGYTFLNLSTSILNKHPTSWRQIIRSITRTMQNTFSLLSIKRGALKRRLSFNPSFSTWQLSIFKQACKHSVTLWLAVLARMLSARRLSAFNSNKELGKQLGVRVSERKEEEDWYSYTWLFLAW
jgi:hypothetical protein